MHLIRNAQSYGYAGKLLRVDLTNERVSIEETAPKLLRQFPLQDR